MLPALLHARASPHPLQHALTSDLGTVSGCGGTASGGLKAAACYIPATLPSHPPRPPSPARPPLPAPPLPPPQAILAQLRDEDEMAQLGGMTELCEYLSISTEDNLVAFPTEQVVPLLVSACCAGEAV